MVDKPSLAVTSTPRVSKQRTFSLTIQSASIICLLFFGLVLIRQGRDAFLRWQERGYRLATRRRYGIPDTDHRPFTVAYAAVLRARQEREAQERNSPVTQNVIAEAQTLRRRHADAGAQRNNTSSSHHTRKSQHPPAVNIFAERSSVHFPGALPADPLNFAERYHPNPPAPHVEAQNIQPSSNLSPPPGSSRRNLTLKVATNEESKKRSLDDEGQSEPVKKTRVEGEELIDGDEDAGWQQSKEQVDVVLEQPRRGAKRGHGDDDAGTKRARHKRPRKHSNNHTVKDGQENRDPKSTSISRGRKRDRAEAGSTFGDGVAGSDSEQGDKIRPTMKRRAMTKKKSEVYSRGQKRDRDAAAHESQDEEDAGLSKSHISRKKRGKKLSEDEGYQGSDVSMEGSSMSQSHLHGRRIGEEWEVNGVQYKIGPNGDRLRQELVKKARSKFLMPKDSHHPDRRANMEVFVEVWLTDDEYERVKDHQQLAWQESPKIAAGAEIPVPESPTKNGKNLLWSSNQKEARPLFRQSISTNVGLRINPFQQSPSSPGRRVASAIASDLTGSPKAAYRSFSKWEKQDLEADAMAKLKDKKMVTPEKKSDEGKRITPLSDAAATPAPPCSSSQPEVKPVQLAETKPPVTTPLAMPRVGIETNKLAGPPAVPVAAESLPSVLPPKPLFVPPMAPSVAAPTVFTSQRPVTPPRIGPSETPTSSAIPTFTLTPPTAKLQTTFTLPTIPSSTAGVPNSFTPQITSSPFNLVPAAAQPNASPNPFNSASAGTSSAVHFPFSPQDDKASASPSRIPPSDLQKTPEHGGLGHIGGGIPLANRLGGFAMPQDSKPAAAGLTSTFFSKPSTSPTTSQTPKSSNVFASTTPTNTPPVALAPATGNAGFKFDFGLMKKNTAPATAAFSTAPKPAMTSFNAEPAKPVVQQKDAEMSGSNAPKFTFGFTSGSAFPTSTGGNQGAISAQASSASTSTATNLAFGMTGGGGGAFSTPQSVTSPAFAASGNIFGTSTPASNPSTTMATRPVFGVTGGGGGAFSTPPHTTTPSAFPTGGNVFGNPSSGNTTIATAQPDQRPGFSFANAGAKPAGTSTPFSFGNTVPSAPTQESKSSAIFKFGSPGGLRVDDAAKTTFGSAAPPSSEQPKTGLSFSGATAPSTSLPSAFGTQSVFGQPGLTPSNAFGFGSSSSGMNMFGNTSGQQQQQQQMKE